MSLTSNLIAIAIIAVVTLVFYDEISDAFGDFFKTQEEKTQAEAFDIKPVIGLPTCDLAITFFGEIEHVLFSLPEILRFEFGANTAHPEIAEFQFLNCQQRQFQIASFFPRLETNIKIIQEEIAQFEITPDQLAELNLTPQELRQLALLEPFGRDFQMQLKIRSVGQIFEFRECSSFNPELCGIIKLPAGIIPEPFTFQKTFLITQLPLQNYNIEIVIVGERINDLETEQPFVYNVRLT